jgi:epoxyqueuosine reductase
MNIYPQKKHSKEIFMDNLSMEPIGSNLRHAHKERIVAIAESLGFDLVRITTADPFPDTRQVIQERIAQGFFSGMDWFTAERADISTDPRALLPQARSVISLGTFYLTDAPRDLTTPGDPHGQISCYAWGVDYHDVIKKRLMKLAECIKQIAEEISVPELSETRLFIDTGRMVDRSVAQRAGIGWFGKNTNLLSRQWGSWVFLSEVVTSLDLEPDPPLAANCGQCQACLTACPTGALVSPGVLDATRCISYLTIEHRGTIPVELRPLIGNLIYGCDICQQVCPVNQVVESRLRRSGKLLSLTNINVEPAWNHPRTSDDSTPALIPLLSITESGFRERFRHSPIKRVKRRGLLRNVCIALGNLGDPAAIPALIKSLHDADPLIRAHAVWALGKIGGSDVHDSLLIALQEELIPEVQTEIRYILTS